MLKLSYNMANRYILLIFTHLTFTAVFSQTPISGIINSYVKVTNIQSCNPCDNSCKTITVTSTAGYAVGDRVVVMQMKGASASTIGDPTFGSVSNYNQAGTFEFNTIASIAGLNITMVSVLKHPYEVAGLVQLIRVPVYAAANVTAMVTGQIWNGNTGGAIILEVTGNLALNASINGNGIGFRGGAALSNGFSYPCGLTDYFYSDPTFDNAATKGEGISDVLVGYELGKGSWANGGGGGNSHNGGGGGGGNGGKGGKGGNDYCSGTVQSGGIGGVQLNSFNLNVYMGGSGGAGHQNNAFGTNGGNGGGIVIIVAGSITGNNQLISSNGIAALNTISGGNDGAGGGGAGGTILLDIPSYAGLLQLSANGGKGGDMIAGAGGHAPGGGGAGGVIATTGASLPVGVSSLLLGGVNGVISSSGLAFGTAPGDPGVITPNFTIINSVGPRKLFANLGSDVTLCDPVSVNLTSGQTDPLYGYQWTFNGAPVSNALSNYFVSSPGTYTVTISSPGCLDGKDTVVLLTQTATPLNAEFCAPPAMAVPLSVIGAGKYKWWSAATGGTALAIGNTYTPTLSVATTFYVEDTSAFKYGNFTPKVQLTGFNTRTGGSNTYMSFNVTRAFTLDSVSMFIRTYNTNTETMVINLRQKGNAVPLATKSLLVTGPCNCTTDREVQFNLGFNLPLGNDYYLEYATGAVNVHWDGSSASYPYSVPGVVSIVQPVDGNGNYIGWASSSYGFFYNWKISAGTPCLRVPVSATLNCGLPIETVSLEVTCNGAFPMVNASIFSSEQGKAIVEYSSDMISIFEDKASMTTIKQGLNAVEFNFNATLNVNPKYFRVKTADKNNVFSYSTWLSNSCTSTYFEIVPNPSSNYFTFVSESKEDIIYSIHAADGKVCLEGHGLSPFNFGSELLSGLYFVKIRSGNSYLGYKIIKY